MLINFVVVKKLTQVSGSTRVLGQDMEPITSLYPGAMFGGKTFLQTKNKTRQNVHVIKFLPPKSFILCMFFFYFEFINYFVFFCQKIEFSVLSGCPCSAFVVAETFCTTKQNKQDSNRSHRNIRYLLSKDEYLYCVQHFYFFVQRHGGRNQCRRFPRHITTVLTKNICHIKTIQN